MKKYLTLLSWLLCQGVAFAADNKIKDVVPVIVAIDEKSMLMFAGCICGALLSYAIISAL